MGDLLWALSPLLACGLFGFWAGWLGGVAEGRARERESAEAWKQASPYPSRLTPDDPGYIASIDQ